MSKIVCPKCGSPNAWRTRDRVDVTLRCLCGYHKILISLLDDLEDEEESKSLRLPTPKSNLFQTLLALHLILEGDSQKITDKLLGMGKEFKVKDVASYLYVLKSKGFVMQTNDRKRLAGGSAWCVTDAAMVLLREKEHGTAVSSNT